MKTLFSFEVPIRHLQDFEEDQDFHFTLSMLYADERYRSFYETQRRERLKAIWLDNSFNERLEAESADRLCDLFMQTRADLVISPDAPNWNFLQLKEAFLDLSMFIPQERIICVASSPEIFNLFIHVGATRFALSYHVRPKLTDEQIDHMEGSHFLGLLSVDELLRHRPRSCDTSMPIKLAMQGKGIKQWEKEGYPHIHTKDLGVCGRDFFQYTMTDEQIRIAKRNIKDLKEAVNGQA